MRGVPNSKHLHEFLESDALVNIECLRADVGEMLWGNEVSDPAEHRLQLGWAHSAIHGVEVEDLEKCLALCGFEGEAMGALFWLGIFLALCLPLHN
jgi:hypothetical protein